MVKRHEMLFESGLIAEAAEPQANFDFALTGQPMRHDHRRVLATALSRLRAKIKYRPVIFELMPPEFTLLQLQNSVEAISGRLLHKQNFRRQIQQQNLIESLKVCILSSLNLIPLIVLSVFAVSRVRWGI